MKKSQLQKIIKEEISKFVEDYKGSSPAVTYKKDLDFIIRYFTDHPDFSYGWKIELDRNPNDPWIQFKSPDHRIAAFNVPKSIWYLWENEEDLVFGGGPLEEGEWKHAGHIKNILKSL
mgnify:CR=1 FL=1